MKRITILFGLNTAIFLFALLFALVPADCLAQTCAALGYNPGDLAAVEICGDCYECGVRDYVCPEIYEGFGFARCREADEDCTNVNIGGAWDYSVPGCPHCNAGWNSSINDPSVDEYVPHSIFNINCSGGDCYSPISGDLICGNNSNEFPMEEMDSEGDDFWVDNIGGNNVFAPFLEDNYGTNPAGTENVLDSTPSRACCRQSTDCVDDNMCYLSVNDTCQKTLDDTGIPGCNNNEAGEPIDLNQDMEVCNSSRWHDPDESEIWCNMSFTDARPKLWFTSDHPLGVDDYDQDKTNGFCGGDDANENVVWESFSPLNDGIDSGNLCFYQSACIDEGICYNSTNETIGGGPLSTAPYTNFTRNIGEPGDTGDYEICNSTDNLPWFGKHDWHDPDELHAVNPLTGEGPYCNTPWTLNGSDLSALMNQCNGGSCWMKEGEDTVFGGYDMAVGQPQLGCCGDDLGEWYAINNETGWDSCCNSTNRCVYHESGICGGCDHVYGEVYVEDPNNPGNYINASDYGSGNDVLIMVYNRSNLENFTYTYDHIVNGTPMFWLTVPSEDKFVLSIEFSSPQHHPHIMDLNIGPGNTDLGTIILDLVKECQPDCTMNDNRCHIECDGINGCDFNESIVATSGANAGLNMAEICDGGKPGWEKMLNDTHVFSCCQGNPRPSSAALVKPELVSDVENIKTFQHTVNYKGKKIKMYVTIWESEE
jgi:hypothetical protein